MEVMHPVLRLIRRTALAGIAVSATGCFSYANVPPGQVAPGTRVAMDLSTRTSADYTSVLGATIDRVEGVLLSATPDSARIQVERARELRGGWQYWAKESLTLPLNGAATFQQRSFSKRRTAIMAGGLILISVQIIKGGLLGFGDPGNGTDPKGTNGGNPG